MNREWLVLLETSVDRGAMVYHWNEVNFASPGIIVSKKIHAQLLCSSKRSTLPCVRKSRGMMKRPQGTNTLTKECCIRVVFFDHWSMLMAFVQ